MIERFQAFLVFCSAADAALLKECPKTEQIKYQGIGATVLFTALLAAISGGYALFTVFKSYPISLVLGLLWGLIIFNLDRFIISSVKKSRSFSRELLQVIPRVLLAIFLAVVISKPLELRIFKQEIDEYLHFTGMEKLAEAEAVYEQKKAFERQQIDDLKAETAALFELREQYYEEYKCECEGTCGTGEKGIGSECLRKERKYLKTDAEYQALKIRNDSLVATHQAQIQVLNTELVEYKSELKSRFADGLMARLDALGKLPWLPSLFVMLLLFAIETAPILVKLLSPYGPYDNLLKVREYEYELREIESVNALNQQLNSKLTVEMGKEHIQIDAELEQNKQAQEMINDAQLELMREELKLWLQEEKNRIHQTHQSKKVS
jgi:hypothetical protein